MPVWAGLIRARSIGSHPTSATDWLRTGQDASPGRGRMRRRHRPHHSTLLRSLRSTSHVTGPATHRPRAMTRPIPAIKLQRCDRKLHRVPRGVTDNQWNQALETEVKPVEEGRPHEDPDHAGSVVDVVRTPENQGDDGYLPKRPAGLTKGDDHKGQHHELLDNAGVDGIGDSKDQLRSGGLLRREVAGLERALITPPSTWAKMPHVKMRVRCRRPPALGAPGQPQSQGDEGDAPAFAEQDHQRQSHPHADEDVDRLSYIESPTARRLEALVVVRRAGGPPL